MGPGNIPINNILYFISNGINPLSCFIRFNEITGIIKMNCVALMEYTFFIFLKKGQRR